MQDDDAFILVWHVLEEIDFGVFNRFFCLEVQYFSLAGRTTEKWLALGNAFRHLLGQRGLTYVVESAENRWSSTSRP